MVLETFMNVRFWNTLTISTTFSAVPVCCTVQLRYGTVRLDHIYSKLRYLV
jgi:hypothetical protein